MQECYQKSSLDISKIRAKVDYTFRQFQCTCIGKDLDSNDVVGLYKEEGGNSNGTVN